MKKQNEIKAMTGFIKVGHVAVKSHGRVLTVKGRASSFVQPEHVCSLTKGERLVGITEFVQLTGCKVMIDGGKEIKLAASKLMKNEPEVLDLISQ